MYRQADCDITPDTTIGELAESLGVSVEDLGFTADGDDVDVYGGDDDSDDAEDAGFGGFGGLFGGDDDADFDDSDDAEDTGFGGFFGGDDDDADADYDYVDDAEDVDADDVDADDVDDDDVDDSRLQQSVQEDTAAIVGDLQDTFGDIQAAFGQLFGMTGAQTSRVQQTNEDVMNDINAVIQTNTVAFNDAVQATLDSLAVATNQVSALFGGMPGARR